MSLNINKPLVSVCIPAYNAGQTIGKTIDSIINQNYPNFEIIVSDNHSTDNTAEIVNQFKKYNVKYFLNPISPANLINTSPVVSNFNYAISLAKGDFIAIYHADDIYHPTIISQQVLFFQENEAVGSVFTSSNLIDEDDIVLNINIGEMPDDVKGVKIIDFPTLLNSIILSEYHLMFPTLMIRSSALIDVGSFNPLESYVSDIEYYLRLARWKPIGLINQKLHSYRSMVGEEKISLVKKTEIIKHYIRFIEEYINSPEIYSEINILNLKYFKMLLCSRKIFLARQYFLQNKIEDARKLLESFKFEYIMLAIKKKNGLQAMFLGSILKVSDNFRLAKIVSIVIERMRHFRYILWHRSLYKFIKDYN